MIGLRPQDLPPRYTQMQIDQSARNTERMGRPYYRAGEKIDGSVIQHCPGTEIIVVDFAKDSELNKFYEQTLAEYKLANAKGQSYSLPLFFYQATQNKLSYDLEIVDGLVNGATQRAIKDRTGVYQKMKDRASDVILDNIAKQRIVKDEKIYVGEYLQLGYGICRQQATIVAACMERAIAKGEAPEWIGGAEIRANLANPTDGHVWVTLLNRNGSLYVYDPAQNYVGLEKSSTAAWPYAKGYENHKFGKPGT